jgi:Flp pilus assembly protein TadD
VAHKTAKAKRKTADRSHPKPASPAKPALQPDALWTAALLIGAVVIAYFPTLHGRILWDDDAHVTRPDLRSIYGLWSIWFDPGATQQYYPLLHSAFWLEHKLWGDAVVGYHLLNILFHASASCLLLVILRRLKIPGASLAAAVFALHPVYVESVAWITEQKNTLSALFYFGAALAYLRFDQERRSPLYAAALGLFVLGLLTKTVVATLPGALLVVFWWQRGRLSWRRDIVPLVPWFALGASAGLLTVWVERKLIGAEGAAFDLTLLQRCLLAGRVIWFYLVKIFWPANLLFIYPRWEIDPAVWWQYLFLLGASALFCALWLIRRRARGPLAGFLFFVGTLLPVLGFLNVYPFVFSFVADHFQYLASLGIIVAVSAAIAALLARLPARARWAGQALCFAVLAALAVMTWRQSRVYRDPGALYQTTLEKNPGCWMCRNNLGILLAHAGQLQAATAQYEQALRIRPDYTEAHNNLGNALLQAGLMSEAMGHYEQALRLNPNYHYAHNNLGRALFLMGRSSEAEKEFEEALRIRPDYAEAHNNLGTTLLQAGLVSQAIGHYEQALNLKPDYPDAHHNLGNALVQAGLVSKALGHYEQALKLKPDYPDAHNNFGGALLMMGRSSEAKKEFEEALRIRPDYAPARENLLLLQRTEQRN